MNKRFPKAKLRNISPKASGGWMNDECLGGCKFVGQTFFQHGSDTTIRAVSLSFQST